VRNRTKTLAVLVAAFLLSLSPLAADSAIQRGIDVFVTPADGSTYYDFAQSPIPAGFFCNASEAFTGRVAFKGLPLATQPPGQLRGGDTIVERLDDAAFNAKGTAVTRIQFKALSLVSIVPIKTACGSFHVYVSLGGRQRETFMSIHRTKENGGTFVAPLAVNARLSFIPVTAKGQAPRKLELAGSFAFPPIPLPWSLAGGGRAKGTGPVLVDTDGDLTPDTLLSSTSNFVPGVFSERLGPNKYLVDDCPCVDGPPPCHFYNGKEHCAYSIPPGCELRLCS
jgi:hypothetical protein